MILNRYAALFKKGKMKLLKSASFYVLLFYILNLTNSIALADTEIPLVKQGGVYTLLVRVNGVITLSFILDSGASEVSIPADVVMTLYKSGTIADADFLPGASAKLADGSVLQSNRFRIRELELGGRRISDIPAIVTPPKAPLLLGLNVLEQFDTWSLESKRHVLKLGSNRSSGTGKVQLGMASNVISASPEKGIWQDPVTGMEFVWVRGGCYQMGCGPWMSDCLDNEKPLHEVCVHKNGGFWMGKTEVTQGQWKRISGGSNPSNEKRGDDYPVEQVSWDDVQAWIGKLNSKNGGQWRFRLPTEAEWEYACRSGGKAEKYSGLNAIGDKPEQSYYMADGVGYSGSVAWTILNSEGSTHPVGTKQKNGLGLYDMSGNVWEWCEDVYSKDAYGKHSKDDPLYIGTGENRGGSGSETRVIRGGSCAISPGEVQCGYRNDCVHSTYFMYTGFRLVMVP